jgi:hypothetical protein
MVEGFIYSKSARIQSQGGEAAGGGGLSAVETEVEPRPVVVRVVEVVRAEVWVVQVVEVAEV